MTHLGTWLGLTAAIVLYRLLCSTSTSVLEHAAGIYFAGVALFLHWLLSILLASRKGASSTDTVATSASKAGEAC